MEIAHAQTGTLRVIGKLVLLGLLIFLLSKVILTLLAVAALGFVTYFCARGLYHRRARFTRILCFTKESVVHAVRLLVRIGTGIMLAAAWCVSWIALAFFCHG